MCFDFCQSFYCVGTVGVVAEALNVVAGGDEPLRATLFEQSFAEDKVPSPRNQHINAVVVWLGCTLLGSTLLSLGFFSHNALEPLLYLAVAILPEF